MKYMFISDIHGNTERLKECINIFEKENANKLVILGDTSAYLDEEADIENANILNKMKDKIIMVRGNCDTRNFEEKLDIEIFDMDNLYVNGSFVTITHGHYYNCFELPSNCGEIFIQGHTHIPMLQNLYGKIVANPGSISKPRGCDLRCYILIDEEHIVLKTIEGKIVKEIKLNNLLVPYI